MNNRNTLIRIVLITALLILSFAVYTYPDKAQFYEDIVVIVISTNLAAHLLPALILRSFEGTGDPFARRLVENPLLSLISIVV